MPHDEHGVTARKTIAEKLPGEKYEKIASRKDTYRPTAGSLNIQSALLLTCILNCSRGCEEYANDPKHKPRDPKASSYIHRDPAHALVLENYVPKQAPEAG
jgi:hypothetical protein